MDEKKALHARERLVVPPNSPATVEVKVEVQGGDPVERILATAKANRCDLIILGTESRTLLTEKVFGSTMSALCHSSKTPMLILRPQLLSTYTSEELALRCRHLFRSLLVPYNGSQGSEYLVAQLKRHAEETPADVPQHCLLLTMIEDHQDRVDQQLLHASRVREAEVKLAAAKAALESSHLAVTIKVDVGEPVVRILANAVEHDITAIALASDAMGWLAEWSNNSFSEEVLRRSWHPVLFFPQR